MNRLAREVMRSAPPRVAPGDPLARGAELMTLFAVREVPVVENETVVGILSRSDLSPHLGYLELTPVRIAMTGHPKTISPNVSVVEVARALLAGGFNGIPVVVDGALAGMISRQDLLRVLAEWPADATD
ncbi:MAG: CBS domain-containing protein [Candidatus Binatia bacterium]